MGRGIDMSMTVTAEYLRGIKEGRDYLKRFKPNQEAMILILNNIERTMTMFSAGPVKDMLKGERDFWRNQLNN